MNIGRRDLLKWIAGAGFGGLLSRPGRARASETKTDAGNQLAALLDISLCTGCRSCEKACDRANGLPAPDIPYEDMSALDKKRRTSAAALTVANRYSSSASAQPVYRKLQCNHCVDPACVSACFVKAMIKTPEGPVIYNPDLCVGCRYCMVACPFYVPAYEYDEALTPRVMKCSMCFNRTVKEGKPPACVESCPLEAILFGKRDELVQIARGRIEKYPHKYVNHIYGEHEVGGTCWMYISNVPFDDVDLPTDLGVEPYPNLTKGAMSAVPVVAVMWPVILAGIYGMNKRNGSAVGEPPSREAAESTQNSAAHGENRSTHERSKGGF